MSRAIGMIEFKTTATGVTAADAMVKAANVTLIGKELSISADGDR